MNQSRGFSTRKLVTGLLVMAAIAVVMLMTACGANRDEALVGRWVWADNSASVTTFNEDGSGSHTISWGYGTTFTWTTPGNDIRWNYPGYRNMYTPYRISGNTLYMTLDDGTVFRYIRNDEALVGRWVWAEDPAFVTVFYEDGRGTHTISWGFGTTFTWTTPGDVIGWDYPGHWNMYTPYRISSNTLYMTMDDGTVFRYIRDN